jgi:two-component system cell cycle sensor histidine kinase/response regulator CckA
MTTETLSPPVSDEMNRPPPVAPHDLLPPDALTSLVHHQHAVEHYLTLEEAHHRFREVKVEFLAVLCEGRVIGLCSRSQVGFIMGSRFGFALYSASTVQTALVRDPIVVPADISAHELLARAFARKGDDFYDDIVLIKPDGALAGLVGTEALVKLQSRLMAGQVDRLCRQQDEMHRQNLDLFRANNALRQSRGLYAGLFESNALGVALLDPAGGIQTHNHRLAELLGLDNGAAGGGALLARLGATERTALLGTLAAHERTGAGGDPAQREMDLEVPGRGRRRFRVTTGWVAETGQVCACLEDVTRQRTMERVVLRQEKQNLLDTLVGGIAHELNNKLTPVLGFADLLEAAGAGTAQAAHAASIRQCTQEAADIIQQLLRFSRPARDAFQPTDLRAAVEGALLMLRFQMREARCETHVRLPDQPVLVQGDPAQLKQIVMNLVINALQAVASRPAPQVEIAVEGDVTHGRVVVRDNGPGIAAEHLARVFDPFFTTKGPDKGTGLGLSICQSLVRQHEGEIVAESEPGGGARLVVTLPRCAETAPPPALVGEPMPGFSLAAPDAASRRPAVLIVEDEEVVRGLLQEIFRHQLGCRVTLAHNGAEGLAALAAADHDLVLSDIRMPVMNGTEFYLRVRETRPDLARRFVFITGHTGARLMEDEIKGWGVPVLAKPFSIARLREVCGPYLNPPPASASATSTA